MYTLIFRDILFGRVYDGPDLDLLQSEIQKYVDVPYALAVNQCRLGLYLAVKASLKRNRKKVILSPFTIFDVVNMIICAGGVPVFADIECPSCTIDPDEVGRLIDNRTAAVIVSHTHMFCSGVNRIVNLCRDQGIICIEDAALAFGTRTADVSVGTHGDIGVYSFGLFKNVNSLFGGIVVTDNAAVYRCMLEETELFEPVPIMKLVSRALYGLSIDIATSSIVFRAFTFWIFRFAFFYNIDYINQRVCYDPCPTLQCKLPISLKCRMTPAQARLARKQIDDVVRDLKKRVKIAEFYHQGLNDLPDVVLPPVSKDISNGFMAYPIQVENRNELLRHLMILGRDCASRYYRNCADLHCFSDFRRNCHNARYAEKHTILLPTYPGYCFGEAKKNILAIRSFFNA
ncbi:MAG: DegT/DnrJ/EryC1/StrS family aminotransferase [Gemmatimonadota bacterium]|nr:DegT/DnrJ/EryC1/StrS family aminotransferase [Gemmatimonadota bacterium]